MIRGVHHFTVHVRDMERMRKFYMDAFGFTDPGFAGGWSDSPAIDEIVGVANSAARSMMLVAGNCYLEIFQYSAPPPDDSMAARHPYEHGYTHFCVDVTDIEAEVERLKTVGMTFDRPHGQGRPVDVSIVKAFFGKVREGNLIEIQETAAGCVFDAKHLPKASIAG
jgi:catechol 2,3-dioxygenase-like lactoylglutathione lyase family enzyme